MNDIHWRLVEYVVGFISHQWYGTLAHSRRHLHTGGKAWRCFPCLIYGIQAYSLSFRCASSLALSFSLSLPSSSSRLLRRQTNHERPFGTWYLLILSAERLGLRCCIYAFYNTSPPMKRGYIRDCLLLHRVWTVLFSLYFFLLKPCILPVFLISNRKCPIERGADPTSTLEYMTTTQRENSEFAFTGPSRASG